MRLVGSDGDGCGVGTTPPGTSQINAYARGEAVRLAIEWARSAGPEHCTRVTPEELVHAAKLFYDFVIGSKGNEQRAD